MTEIVPYTQFPVEVRFSGVQEYYTLGGKFHTCAVQTLFPCPVKIVKKVTKPSINWDHVGSKYNYLVEDSEGCAFLLEEEPFIVTTDESAWCTQGDEAVEANGFASYTPGTCDWRDSLIKRPESDNHED